jgi:hypothetical protein
MLLQGEPAMTIDSVLREAVAGAGALAEGAPGTELAPSRAGGTMPTSVLRLPRPNS